LFKVTKSKNPCKVPKPKNSKKVVEDAHDHHEKEARRLSIQQLFSKLDRGGEEDFFFFFFF